MLKEKLEVEDGVSNEEVAPTFWDRITEGSMSFGAGEIALLAHNIQVTVNLLYSKVEQDHIMLEYGEPVGLSLDEGSKLGVWIAHWRYQSDEGDRESGHFDCFTPSSIWKRSLRSSFGCTIHI